MNPENKCRACGEDHTTELCDLVFAIDYDHEGRIIRLEFYPDSVTAEQKLPFMTKLAIVLGSIVLGVIIGAVGPLVLFGLLRLFS